jgi:hypothetical protein
VTGLLVTLVTGLLPVLEDDLLEDELLGVVAAAFSDPLATCATDPVDVVGVMYRYPSTVCGLTPIREAI